MDLIHRQHMVLEVHNCLQGKVTSDLLLGKEVEASLALKNVQHVRGRFERSCAIKVCCTGIGVHDNTIWQNMPAGNTLKHGRSTLEMNPELARGAMMLGDDGIHGLFTNLR